LKLGGLLHASAYKDAVSVTGARDPIRCNEMYDDLDDEQVKIGKRRIVAYNTALYPHSSEGS
jgi:hypothetical protein